MYTSLLLILVVLVCGSMLFFVVFVVVVVVVGLVVGLVLGLVVVGCVMWMVWLVVGGGGGWGVLDADVDVDLDVHESEDLEQEQRKEKTSAVVCVVVIKWIHEKDAFFLVRNSEGGWSIVRSSKEAVTHQKRNRPQYL